MKFKELLQNTNMEDVIKLLSEDECEKDFIEEYRILYTELLNKKETDNPNLHLFIVNQKDYIEDYEGISVFGYDTEEEMVYALDLMKRDKWLGSNVVEKSVNAFGKTTFIAECLKEISFISFNEEVVEKEKETLNEMIKEIESGEAKTFTHEEVIQELNEELEMDIKIKEYSIEEKEEMSKKFKEIKEYNDNEVENMLSEIKR